MKNTIVEVREEYVCDICGKAMRDATFELGPMANSGTMFIDCTEFTYSYSLVMSRHGKPVTHVCNGCLKAFFLKLGDSICAP